MRMFRNTRSPYRLFPGALWSLLLIFCQTLALADPAMADPPSRVARISYVSGQVGLSAAEAPDWAAAPLNRPLAVGDRLWVDDGALVEIRTGNAALRASAGTQIALMDFDDNAMQVQLGQGSVRLHVDVLDAGQFYEIATPNLAFTITRPGDYRVDVQRSDNTTVVIVRRGEARVDSEGIAYTIYAGRAYRFGDTGLRRHGELALPAPDALDQWANERDQRFVRSVSGAYVSPGVIGYEDLDGYGAWRSDATYGSVWFPSVTVGWSPYTTGRWNWVAPWGWTWVDEAPWGFAVSHYGRWAQISGAWGWVPGPARTRAVYAPALVSFIGGPGFQLSLTSGPAAGVAWFPLAPYEPYRPWYPVSRTYFSNVNVSNTFINTNRITVLYDHQGWERETHAHRNLPGAVVAVPAGAFASAQPIRSSIMRLRDDDLSRIRHAAPLDIVPQRQVPRAGPDIMRPPPEPAFERSVVTRHTPPAPRPAVGGPGFPIQTTPQGGGRGDALPRSRGEPDAAPVPGMPLGRTDTPAPLRAPVLRGEPAGRDSQSGPIPRSGRDAEQPTRGNQQSDPAISRQGGAVGPADLSGQRQSPGAGQPSGGDFRGTGQRGEPLPRPESPAPRGDGGSPRFESPTPRFEPAAPRGDAPGARPDFPARRGDPSDNRPEASQPRFDAPPRGTPRFEQPRFEQPVSPGVPSGPQPGFRPPSDDRSSGPQPGFTPAVPSAPERPRPQFESPRFESPRFESPRFEQPRGEPPRIESPRFEAPRMPAPTSPPVTPMPSPAPSWRPQADERPRPAFSPPPSVAPSMPAPERSRPQFEAPRISPSPSPGPSPAPAPQAPRFSPPPSGPSPSPAPSQGNRSGGPGQRDNRDQRN